MNDSLVVHFWEQREKYSEIGFAITGTQVLTILEAENGIPTNASGLIDMKYRLMIHVPPLDFASTKIFHD